MPERSLAKLLDPDAPQTMPSASDWASYHVRRALGLELAALITWDVPQPVEANSDTVYGTLTDPGGEHEPYRIRVTQRDYECIPDLHFGVPCPVDPECGDCWHELTSIPAYAVARLRGIVAGKVDTVYRRCGVHGDGFEG